MKQKKRFTKDKVMMGIFILLSSLYGGFLGFLSGRMMDELGFAGLLVIFFSVFLSIPFHIILHEVGHLIAGKLSGYEFIMFRLFNSVWIKTHDGISRRKEYVSGILGQALMVPPTNTEHPPFLLYHLGGILVNLLTALIFWFSAPLFASAVLIYFFRISAVTALFLGLSNAFPVKGTDGYNILQFFKDNDQQTEVTAVLNYYQQMVQGVPFTELRKDINLTDHTDLTNPLTVNFHDIHALAYLEEENFEAAREIYHHLWRHLDQLFEGHKMEMNMSYLFTLLLTDPTHPDVEEIKNSKYYKTYQKLKQVDSYRLLAAEAMYVDHDFSKANQLLTQGEAEIQFTPTVSDEQLERQLYQYLRNELTSQ